MAFHMGWFTTGRDPAARNLLETVYTDIVSGNTPASIDWIFCHRETGDGPVNEEYRQRELFFDMAARFDMPVATLSHVRFRPELRRRGLEESRSAAEAAPALSEWRNAYGREVVKVIQLLPPVDIVVMAGYMLIIGEPELEALNLINIHPALPWGPKGTWQEVIHELIDADATEQGIMIHIVTKELDRGPVISYCRFPIRGERWNHLWDSWNHEITPETVLEKRETHPLFTKVRSEGEVRELPLMRSAIRELAHGNIVIENKKIRAVGEIMDSGVDLTESIENILRDEGIKEDQQEGTFKLSL